MTMDSNTELQLDRALAALPRSVQPRHDLWVGIEAHLDRRQAALSWPMALAAGFALVAVTALVTLMVVDARRAPVQVAATASTLPGLSVTGTAADAKLIATRGELKRAFEERMPLLAPATRAAVMHSLSTIQAAHRELEQALAADPSSTLVRDLLYATAEQEYSLYQDVLRSTDTLAVRT